MQNDVWKAGKLLNRESPSRTRDADKPPEHFSSLSPDNRFVSGRQTTNALEPSLPDWEGQLSTLVPMVLKEDENSASSLDRTKGNNTIEDSAGLNMLMRHSISESTRTTSVSVCAADSTLGHTAFQESADFMEATSGASMVDHPTAQTSPIDGVSKLATLLHSNPEDSYIAASLNTHSCASSPSSASVSVDTPSVLSRASLYDIHTQVIGKGISHLYNRPFWPAFINTVSVFPSKHDRNLPHISLSSAVSTSMTAAPYASSGMLGRSDSPVQQADTSSLAVHCCPTTLPECIPSDGTHNVSLPTVSKFVDNNAATNDPSAIATTIYTPLCKAGTISPPLQDLSSTMQSPRQMTLKRLLAKPAPISVNPPCGYPGTGAEDLHDSPRKVLSKSDIRGGWEAATSSTRTEDGYVRKYRKEDKIVGKQDDVIAIFPSGAKFETQVNSSSVRGSPVTTHGRQITVQRSNVSGENVLMARSAGVLTCDTAIETGPGLGFPSVEATTSIPPNGNGHGNVKAGYVERLRMGSSPTKNEMVMNKKEKTPKKNILRRKRSITGLLHNTHNFSNTDLAGASQPEGSKRLTSSELGSHVREIQVISVAADASAGILHIGSLSVPTPADAPIIEIAHQQSSMHQSCNESIPFGSNDSMPGFARNGDVVHSAIDRQPKRKECKARGVKSPSASPIGGGENKKTQGIIEEQNRWTRPRHADEANIRGGKRRAQRSASPGNEGCTLSTSAKNMRRRECNEPQRRAGHRRNGSKQGKVQECVQEAVLPWRGAGEGPRKDETLDSSTALQLSKHPTTGYVLAVGRSGDSSDDCDYSDSPDSKSVGHGTSMVQKPSFTERRKGVMSDHGHGGGSAPDTVGKKPKMASWENCKQKGMLRATRRSDKSLRNLNISQRDSLTKGAGKPLGKPDSGKSWWGLMRRLSVSITRERRIKPSPSMPALSDWSRSTETRNSPSAPTPSSSECLDQPSRSRMVAGSSTSSVYDVPPVPKFPAAVALRRRIISPSILEKAYSQEEEKNESSLQSQVDELQAPLAPSYSDIPREGDWVRSQSPDIELVSLPLPPRKSSKQVSSADSVHSFASSGKNDENRFGSPMIPTFSIDEAINAFPCRRRFSPVLTSKPNTLALTQADTPVAPTPSVISTSGSSTGDPPDSTSPPVASSSAPTSRQSKSSSRSSVIRLPSVDVPPSSTVHNRHRPKSTGPESNRSLSSPTQTTESPTSDSPILLSLQLSFLRSQSSLSASAPSAMIRPGTANTFGVPGLMVRPGTSESRNSVASEMTIIAGETGISTAFA